MRIRKLITMLILIAFFGSACEAPWRGPPDWDSIFVQDRVVRWDLTVSDADWLKLISPMSFACEATQGGTTCAASRDCPDACRCQDGTCVVNYVEADLTVDDGFLYPRVGLRFMGDYEDAKGGTPGSKVNMRIRFNRFDERQTFFGLKRLNIRNNAGDPTLVREALAHRLFLQAGVPAQRTSFVWVSINGEPGGIYTLVQQIDKKFLDERFGEDWGNLYKLEPGGDLVYAGDNPGEYRNPSFEARYEKKTNGLDEDRSDLLYLMRVLALGRPPTIGIGPEPEFEPRLEDELGEVLDVDRFLRALAVNTWLANMDSYAGTGDKIYLYHDSFGRFRYVPWDLNRAFGNYHGSSCDHGLDLAEQDPDAPTCGDVRPMVDYVLACPGFLATYHDHLQDLVDGVLHPDAVRVETERLRARIEALVPEDGLYQRAWLLEDFGASFEADVRDRRRHAWVPGMLPFVEARDKRVRDAIGGQ